MVLGVGFMGLGCLKILQLGLHEDLTSQGSRTVCRQGVLWEEIVKRHHLFTSVTTYNTWGFLSSLRYARRQWSNPKP